MNCNVDMDWIADQFAEDPVAAEAEYNAQFRASIIAVSSCRNLAGGLRNEDLGIAIRAVVFTKRVP